MIEERPWGSFEVLAEGEGYKVKRLIIQAGKRISLQKHKFRDEIWYVMSGPGFLTKGESLSDMRGGLIDRRTEVFIPSNHWHRLEGMILPVVIIELQIGDCKEDDIERIADDYGRV